MTISELGRRLKARYPEYSDMTDRKAGEAVIQKYPQYLEQVSSFDDLIKNNITPIAKQPSWFLNFRIKKLDNQRRYTEAEQARVVKFISSVYELENLQTNLERAQILGEHTFNANLEHVKTLAEVEIAQRKLLAAATELGLSVTDYSEVQKETLRSFIRTNEEQRMSNIRIDEHLRRTEIDIEKEERTTQIQLQAALSYMMITSEKQRAVFAELMKLVRERYTLSTSGEPGELVQEQTRYYNRLIEAKGQQLEGLIQGDDGKNAEGSD